MARKFSRKERAAISRRMTKFWAERRRAGKRATPKASIRTRTRKQATPAPVARPRRRIVERSTETRTSVQPRPASGIGPLSLGSTCVLCRGTVADHFATDGRYVGCIGLKRGQDSALFFPPVMVVTSAALNALIQPVAGNGNHVGAAAAAAPAISGVAADGRRMQRRVGPSSVTTGAFGRGRPAENIVANVTHIDKQYGEKLSKVFGGILKHKRNGGITLKALVDVVGMPYSTVQSQVNKLIAMGAAQKQKLAA